VAGKTGAGPSGDDPERGRPGSPGRSGLHDGPVARAFSPPQKAAGRADARRARKSFNDQRNAGGEPNAADISDQEYRVVAWVRGNRREDIVDREIAISRQGDGMSDWRGTVSWNGWTQKKCCSAYSPNSKKCASSQR
jgi:hypothetical protein